VIYFLDSVVQGSTATVQPGGMCSGNGILSSQTVQNNGDNKEETEIECEDFAGNFESGASSGQLT
jgi:hypothetical protein